MRSSCMRERVSVCVVSCGGGRPANLFLSLFQKESGRNKKRKMSGSFVGERLSVVWFGRCLLQPGPQSCFSLPPLILFASSLGLFYICKRGRKRTPLDYRPPGRGPSMGLGTRELFRLTRLCR